MVTCDRENCNRYGQKSRTARFIARLVIEDIQHRRSAGVLPANSAHKQRNASLPKLDVRYT